MRGCSTEMLQVRHSWTNPCTEFITKTVNNSFLALLVSSLSPPQQFIFPLLKYMIINAPVETSAFLACAVKCSYLIMSS